MKILIKSFIENTNKQLDIKKTDFIFEHASDNIRDDYLIGKTLGTGTN